MALFIKNVNPETDMPMRYTTGLEQTKVVVGLGNPGSQHVAQRHNIGFRCLEDFLSSYGEPKNFTDKKSLKSQTAIVSLAGCRLILAKPQTFMNLSGAAVQAVLHFYKLPTSALVVIHDDIDVNFGVIKTKLGGGGGGHNGLTSITRTIGDDFYRIRVGIGPKRPANRDLGDFVLKDFSSKEQSSLSTITAEVSSIIGAASAGDLSPKTYQCL